MITTTLEQSKKFVKLGINPSTADMYYPNRIGIDNYALPIEWKNGLPLLSQEIPAWSLEALLKILPYRIEEVIGYKVELTIFKLDGGWTVIYRDNKGLRHGPSCVSNNLVDACVEMIIKLKKENLL